MGKKKGSFIDRHIKYIFTVPLVLFILAAILFPILYTLVLSFHSWRMSTKIPWEFVGLSNFRELFSLDRFWFASLRTIVFTAVSMTFQVSLGIGLAFYLNREFKGKNMVKTFFLLPMVTTPVAVGMVWTLIYEPTIGVANYLLKLMKISPLDWLGSTKIALPSLMLIDIWQWTPMVMLIVLAGLTTIPEELVEAALVDGANAFQRVRIIIFPLLWPSVFTAALLRLIDSLKTFDIIYSTTQGGPGYATETINILAYRRAFEYFRMGEASTTLIVFFLIVLFISGLAIYLKSRTEVYN